MFTRDEIIDGIGKVKVDGAAFWGAFDTPHFFASLGDAWSPADNVRHLTMSFRAVVAGLRAPKIILWWKFGKARKPSHSYEAVRDRYVEIPAKKAGRFSQPPDRDAFRAALLEKLDTEHVRLAIEIRNWSERDLDQYRMPHPLMGKLTAREMLFFSIYHHRHHMEGVRRRLG